MRIYAFSQTYCHAFTLIFLIEYTRNMRGGGSNVFQFIFHFPTHEPTMLVWRAGRIYVWRATDAWPLFNKKNNNIFDTQAAEKKQDNENTMLGKFRTV